MIKHVTGGRKPPKNPTYACIVSREMVRIAMMIAALNDPEVKTSDIQNAFLTAPCTKTIHTTLGPEFGEDQGKTAINVHTLYTLMSACASFHKHLLDCMCHLGYHSCFADPDRWYKPIVHPSDNFQYYSYVPLYVDDCLCLPQCCDRTQQGG